MILQGGAYIELIPRMTFPIYNLRCRVSTDTGD